MFTYKESVIKKTGSKIDVGLLRKIYRILYYIDGKIKKNIKPHKKDP